MNNFVTSKEFFHVICLYFFHRKFSSFSIYCEFVKVYGKHAPSEQTCEKWFSRFLVRNFDLDNEQMETICNEEVANILEVVKKRENKRYGYRTHAEKKFGIYIIFSEHDGSYVPFSIPSPKKTFWHTVSIHYFNKKKSPAECMFRLKDLYGDQVPSERTCSRWFSQFKKGNFVLAVNGYIGASKKFKDKELIALVNEDPSKTQEEFAVILGVTQQTISFRLKILGFFRKEGKWTMTSAVKL